MPDDTVRIMCPKLTCRKVLAVPSTARGKTVRCRACGTSIRVPTLESPPTEAPPSKATQANGRDANVA